MRHFQPNTTPPTSERSASPPHHYTDVIIPVEDKKQENPSEIQNLPRKNIFYHNQFTPLLNFWISSFDKQQTPECAYDVLKYIMPTVLAAICASGYYGTGRALFEYFKKIGVFSQTTTPFWEYMWTTSVTAANFFQIQKFAGDELMRLNPELAENQNRYLFQLYRDRAPCESVQKALQVVTAMTLQTSVAFLVQVINDSWKDFTLVLAGEFVLMLSAVSLISDTIKEVWHSIKSLCHTADDTVTLQIKYHGFMRLTPDLPVQVDPSELSAVRQQLIITTLQNFTARLEKVMRDTYQIYLTSSDRTDRYGSIQSNRTTFENILQLIQESSNAKNTLGSKLILDLFKPLLAESTPPAPLLPLGKNIKLSLQFTPQFPEASLHWSERHESPLIKKLRILSLIVTTLPLALVSPLNLLNNQLDTESPDLPQGVSAIFGLSATAISLLMVYVNKNRITTFFKALETIRDKGISHWYAQNVRPATWAHNTWKQVPYLLTLSALMIIASQAYSSILKSIVLSSSGLLNIQGENRQLLAKILWPIMSLSNLIFNLDFTDDVLDSVKNIIDCLTSRWATPKQKAIIEFAPSFTRLLTYLAMPFKQGTTFFPQQPVQPAFLIQTFFALFDGLILSTPENEREAMTQKCFSMSLDDLKRVMVTTVQELHLNPELNDLKQSLARTNYLEQITDLLAEFEVTLTSDSSDSDEKSLPKKATLPFELTDDNIVSLKKVPAKKTSSWSWCSLYSRGNSSESKDDSMEPILVRIGAEDEVSEEQARASRSSSSIWNCFRRHSERMSENESQPMLPPPAESGWCTIM